MAAYYCVYGYLWYDGFNGMERNGLDRIGEDWTGEDWSRLEGKGRAKGDYLNR